MANQIKKVGLTNANGMRVEVANYGARLVSIKMPLRDQMVEMLATVETDEQLLHDDCYLGATCGPVCNRISGAGFDLNGQSYVLEANDGDNCLHSGADNLGISFWQLAAQSDDSVTFELELQDGFRGFPGNRRFRVTYQLDDNNRLAIAYEVVTDKDTPINLTNHAYFNLGETNALELQFTLASKEFLERHSNGIPSGKTIAVTDCGYDLAQWQHVGCFFNNNLYSQFVEERGVDHCFVLEATPFDSAKAELLSEQNQVKLSVYSDQPAIQFYTGKFLPTPYQGLCFESQGYTDAVNQPEFPSVVLSAGDTYRHKLVYEFTDLNLS